MEVAPRMPRRAPLAALRPGASVGRSSRSYLSRTSICDSVGVVAVGACAASCAIAVDPAPAASMARTMELNRSARPLMVCMDWTLDVVDVNENQS